MKLSKRDRDGGLQDENLTCTRCHAEKVKTISSLAQSIPILSTRLSAARRKESDRI